MPPSTSELYYLRMMLSITKGSCCYEDIRTVNGIQYSTFREAFFAMGFLHARENLINSRFKLWGVTVIKKIQEKLVRPHNSECW